MSPSPPSDTDSLLRQLKTLTEDGDLAADVIAAYSETHPPEVVPAQTVRDQVLRAQQFLANVAQVPEPARAQAYGEISDLLSAAAENAETCEDHIVGSDPEHTAELEGHWRYIYEVLDQAAAAAANFQSYWQGWQAARPHTESPT